MLKMIPERMQEMRADVSRLSVQPCGLPYGALRADRAVKRYLNGCPLSIQRLVLFPIAIHDSHVECRLAKVNLFDGKIEIGILPTLDAATAGIVGNQRVDRFVEFFEALRKIPRSKTHTEIR